MTDPSVSARSGARRPLARAVARLVALVSDHLGRDVLWHPSHLPIGWAEKEEPRG